MEYSHDFLPSMSSEELEKLNSVRPETFAAASQMQGITPHSLVYLYNYVTRKSKVGACGVLCCICICRARGCQRTDETDVTRAYAAGKNNAGKELLLSDRGFPSLFLFLFRFCRNGSLLLVLLLLLLLCPCVLCWWFLCSVGCLPSLCSR